MYKYKHLGKDNGKSTDQNSECNDEKWKNLNLVVVHKSKIFFTLINSQIRRDKYLCKNMSNNRPTKNFMIKSY